MNSSIVILAAGLGTRMKSRRAKVLHCAGGVPLIEHVIRAALAVTPPERIVAVVGHQAGEVERLLRPYGIRFALQDDPKGTGHAVMAAQGMLEREEGLVVVLYGDTPLLSPRTLLGLIRRQQEAGAAATLITMTLDDPTGYGRVLLDQQGNVRAIVEQKAANAAELAIRRLNSGMYCFHGELLWKHIREIQPNAASGEYYLTDMAEILARAGLPVGSWHIEDPTELLGINTRVELARVDRLLRERKTNELMLAGVTIERPETVSVDVDVSVAMDTVIEPFARLLGRSVVGEECRIGAGAIVQDSELADKVEVAPYTIIASSRIETGALIGPFARLRPDSHVESGAHIGNFVELKKTHMGAGAKSQHLAYLGDADIGDGTNIGAGTIICNYDGAEKHRTTIGRNAFVGSNATLVAPVEIGEGSYIGAGSVITDPVPPDALALGRGRQVNKEGWAARRRMKRTASKPRS